jgi:hypothetical protein
MTPQAIGERLREMSRLSDHAPARSPVDMSPHAITARLRELNQLSTFCRQLMQLGAAHRAR